MLRLTGFQWDEDSESHIWVRHRVTPREVEEAALSAGLIDRGRGKGVYQIYGRTESGRYLFVLIRLLEDACGKVITARQMSDKERSRYKRYMYH